MKLVVHENESVAEGRYLRRRRPLVSSSLARTEAMRAPLPGGDEAAAAGRKVLTRLDLIRVSSAVLDDAAVLLPADLRSLDAIHVALPESWGTTSER